MKSSALLAAFTASCVIAVSLPKHDAQSELRTVKFSPSDVRQITEEQKFHLLAQGTRLIDITKDPSLVVSSDPGSSNEATTVIFHSSVAHQAAVEPLLAKLSTDRMKSTLEPFSKFKNRYYKSPYGAQSSTWLFQVVRDLLASSGVASASVCTFDHSFVQSSVIAKIPGRSDKTIVLGAHQDSINEEDPDQLNNRAPGADDDGSGTVTILEVLRVLLTDEGVRKGQAPNTLEFHWYAGEEGGLLGSAEGKNVKAMLQQDITGYSQGTTDKGEPETVGVVTDYVDEGLTEFITKVIDAYSNIGYVFTECGYGCSDHASVYENGYPSFFVFESKFEDISPFIHTSADTVETINYQHMLQHAKISLGFAYELAYAADL